MDAQFSISWDAQKSFLSGLIGFQQKGEYVDMTLAADGHFVRVHQVVLALSSPYFGELIKSAQIQNNTHPILFLNGISSKTLTYLLEYMYTGEVSTIPIEHLVEFMDAGKKLSIRGIEKLENPLLTVQKRTETQNRNTEEYNIIQVGNETDGNKTDGNETDGNKTDGNETDGNKTDGNETDENDDAHDDNKKEPTFCEVTIPGIMEVKKNTAITKKTEILIKPYFNTPDTRRKKPIILAKRVRTLPKPTSIAPNPNTKIPKITIGKSEDIIGPIQGNMQYTISNKGSLQMIFNRFIYYAKYTSKSRLRQWRCVDYLSGKLKCPAYVITKEEAIMQRVSAHNHSFHDLKILKKLRAGAIYTSINEVEVIGKQPENEDSTMIDNE